MTVRTFIQQGQGYGSNPVQVVAKIDGNTVFSGAVPTIDGSPPPGGDPNVPVPSSNLFSWTNDAGFSGQQEFEVIVSNGILVMTSTVANYISMEIVDPATGNLISYSGNANAYYGFWTETIGDARIADCFVDEKIDGMSQEEHPDPGVLNGQWWWYVPNGSVFTATMNVSAGNVGA